MVLTVQDLQGAQALDITQLIDRWNGFGVVNGGQCSAGANPFGVAVDAATVLVDGVEHSISADVIDLADDVSDDNPRKAIIYVDSNGVLVSKAGKAERAQPEGKIRTETTRPAPPDLFETDETGRITRIIGTPLCEIWLGQNDERITDADIQDRRFSTALVASSAELSSLVVSEFVDGAGVRHTGELADAADVPTETNVTEIINNDVDHGSTAPHNYRTDAEIRAAVEGDVDAAALTSASGTADQYLRSNADGTSDWVDIPNLEAPVLAQGIVTHTGGGATTVEVTGISTTQTESFDINFGVDTALLADYAFNVEWSREWDNTNGKWDAYFTFTWETGMDPGAGNDIDIAWVAYNSQPTVVTGRFTSNDAVAAMSGAEISPAIVDISQALEMPIYDDLANHPGATEGDLAVATGAGPDAAGLYLYDPGTSSWNGPFAPESSVQLSDLQIDTSKDMGGHTFRNLAAPSNPADAARKQEVDAVSNKVDAHAGDAAAHHTRFTLDEVRQLLLSVYNWNESGWVESGEAGTVISADVADGETLSIYRIGIIHSEGSPLPSGMSVRIITTNGDGSYTDRGAVVSGDGSEKNDIVGFNPAVATWTNTTGAEQTTILVVDNGKFGNGTGAAQPYESEGLFEVR